MKHFVISLLVFTVSLAGLIIISEKRAELESNFILGAADISTGEQVNIKSENILDSIEENTNKGTILLIAYDSKVKIQKRENEIERGLNYIKEKKNENESVYTIYTGGDQFYYNEKTNEWTQIEYATSTPSVKVSNLKIKAQVFRIIRYVRAQTSYSAGAGDGFVNKSDASYSTARSAATGRDVYPTTAIGTGCRQEKSGTTFWIHRDFFPTDTSAIGDSDTITAATLNITVNASGAADATSNAIYLVPTDQASNSTLTTADFNNCGHIDCTTKWSDATSIPSIATDTLFTVTLNATGISGISKTGVTLLGMRNEGDCDNQAPTGDNYLYHHFSEQTGTSKDPYLSITVSAGAVSATTLIMPMIQIIQ